MTMSQLAPCASSAPAANASAAETADGQPQVSQRTAARVLLVGTFYFAWLRRLQERAPGPRIDLRYLVEGAITLIQSDESAETSWMALSREALVRHVTASANTSISGTGRILAEGVTKARTSGPPIGHGRHDDCRALQIGEQAFQWLKGKQGTTRDPRLDMRYLVEGALALLTDQPVLLPRVVGLARRALCAHLVELDSHPIEPFLLEKSQ